MKSNPPQSGGVGRGGDEGLDAATAPVTDGEDTADQARPDLPDWVAVHVNDLGPLLERATQTARTTDLVLAPIDLHRRNLKLRLADAGQPLDAFQFVGPTTVATCVLRSEAATAQPRSLDRVDRLALLEALLAEEHAATDHFRMVIGGKPARNAKVVDQVRTEIESLTNFHPTRVAAVRAVSDSLPAPIDADARDVLAGALAVERALRSQGSKAVSDRALMRRAARELLQTDGAAWPAIDPVPDIDIGTTIASGGDRTPSASTASATASPTAGVDSRSDGRSGTSTSIERVAVVGLSGFPAPVLDFVSAIGRTCDIGVELYLRAVTESLIRDRLSEVLAVQNLGQVVFA